MSLHSHTQHLQLPAHIKSLCMHACLHEQLVVVAERTQVCRMIHLLTQTFNKAPQQKVNNQNDVFWIRYFSTQQSQWPSAEDYLIKGEQDENSRVRRGPGPQHQNVCFHTSSDCGYVTRTHAYKQRWHASPGWQNVIYSVSIVCRRRPPPMAWRQRHRDGDGSEI